MKYLILYLLCAHIVGDFYLQCDSFCEKKREESWYGLHKFYHSAIIFVVSWVASLSWNGWCLALCIAFSHWLIDVLKAIAENTIKVKDNDKELKKKPLKDSRYMLWSLVVDQILHLLAILLFSKIWLTCNETTTFECMETNFGITLFLFVIFALIAHRPSNIFVSLFLRLCQTSNKGKPEEDSSDAEKTSCPVDNEHGNFRCGAALGTIERWLMMAFVIIGQYEAIGFLIAAKSILRFSETSKGSEKAEYVLTGTFVSVSIALLFGILIANKCWVFS